MASRVLLVDDLESDGCVVSWLEAMQYDVTTASDLSLMPPDLASDPPDLIILGHQSSAPDKMLENLNALFAVEGRCLPPTICLVDQHRPETRLLLLKGGVRSALVRPVAQSLFLATVRRTLRDADTTKELNRRKAAAVSFGFGEATQGFAPARRVAAVGFGEDLDEIIRRLSSALGYPVTRLSAVDALRERPGERAVDAYVILCETSPADQLRDLLAELRLRSHSRNAAICVLHPEDRPDLGAEALNAGAGDVAPVTVGGPELAFRIGMMLQAKTEQDILRKSSEDSYRLATTDALTGLYNRLYAETYLQDALDRARATGRELAVMMIDVDHFKAVNDSHGHAAGDDVLRAVAHRIRDNLRMVDLVARQGGEEFIVVMPETSRAEAGPAADRLRTKIGSLPIRLESGIDLRVTASIGVSVWNPAETPVRTRDIAFASVKEPLKALAKRLVADADGALYGAKAGGRDRINLAPTAA